MQKRLLLVILTMLLVLTSTTVTAQAKEKEIEQADNVSTHKVKINLPEKSNKTYKLNIEKNTIEGKCEGIDAIKQTIYCILNTERFNHLIYSWNYGIEIEHLIGESITYVIPELERVINEALIQDSRVVQVSDFKFEVNKNK